MKTTVHLLLPVFPPPPPHPPPPPPPQLDPQQQQQQRTHPLTPLLPFPPQDFRLRVAEALALPPGQKPTALWQSLPAWRAWVAALEAAALEDDGQPEQLSTAAEVLRSLGISASRPAMAATALLIDIGHWSYHENVPLRKAKLATAFSEELERAAEELAAAPGPDPDAASREDLTHLKTVTIDSEDTTEIDDALSVQALPDGAHRVWVHIADPSRFVPLGHPLEEEAARRGTSVYFPTGHVPMFPKALAAGPMSLRQGVESCALTVVVDVAADGSVVSSRMLPSTVRVTYRLTYDGADELLAMELDEEKARPGGGWGRVLDRKDTPTLCSIHCSIQSSAFAL